MKNPTIILLILSTLLLVISCNKNKNIEGFYIVNSALHEYNGTATDVIIPKNVTSIKNNAFMNENITSVTIPAAVTIIDHYAFNHSNNLKNINVAKNNKTYTSIDGVLFNKDKTELIKYPANKKNIDYIIPKGITTVKDHSFQNCKNLKNLTISDEVVSINYFYAIENCSVLSGINVDERNILYSSIDGVLFNKNKTELVKYPKGRTEKIYTVPDTVIKIHDWAFYENTHITNIIIPNGIKTIGMETFDGCKSLISVEIPDGVTTIEYSAFGGCSSLTKVIIPDSVKSIGTSAFFFCTQLSSIFIPKSVKEVATGAFYGCTALTPEICAELVRRFGEHIFYPGTPEFKDMSNLYGSLTETRGSKNNE